jgi:hypothetical protein
MDRQRRLPQRIDDILIANPHREFTIAELADAVGVQTSVADVSAAITSAIRCPWRNCNAFDTEFHETVDARAGTEVYHCHRCGRHFHVWRTADGLGILAVVPLPTKPDDNQT